MQPLSQRSAQYLKGVGPRRVRLLERLGIRTVTDALYYLPRRYEDRSRFVPIRDVRPGQSYTLRGSVRSSKSWRSQRGRWVLEVALGDETGVIHALWFNQPYLRHRFAAGAELIIYGRVERFRKLQVVSPEYELVESSADASIHMGRIVPVYPTTHELPQRALRTILTRAVDQHAAALQDPYPTEARQQWHLPPLADAIRLLHRPEDVAATPDARRRLVFDELLLLQLRLALKRRATRQLTKPVRYQVEGPLLARFRERLPFALTAGQEQAIREMMADLQQPQPMNRLLHGEVGSGKTIVAAHALLAAVQSGHQGAIMVPTEILAEQHAATLRYWLAPLGVTTALLVAGQRPAERRALLTGIKAGAVQLVVGTQALLTQAVVWKQLSLVIIDEQHKFGVMQRAALRRKGFCPDVLVMTATPIPRTLAMTLYGDLDISTLRELPPGRRTPATVWLPDAQREQAYELVRQAVADGHQAYVVYPVIETSATRALRAATQMYEQLREEIFPGLTVGLLHGRLRPEEKDEVMREFVEGRVQVLVSTVVIEVGIDVPNATVMLIEHAERFGLAQLHQLRGRIARSRAASRCILLADVTTEEAQERLTALVELSDGFALAEIDLRLRGPGELFGVRQHGEPQLKITNLLTDEAILVEAKAAAEALLREDPGLRRPGWTLLRSELGLKLAGPQAALASVG
ncbi:MAG: ATP-dependent DNA helicase RecG [Candidatus Omnitrophica bacterium]|nr:ATP-dependent DNA helicase RecG [Candidatus Omnitrophota bacterium]